MHKIQTHVITPVSSQRRGLGRHGGSGETNRSVVCVRAWGCRPVEAALIALAASSLHEQSFLESADSWRSPALREPGGNLQGMKPLVTLLCPPSSSTSSGSKCHSLLRNRSTRMECAKYLAGMTPNDAEAQSRDISWPRLLRTELQRVRQTRRCIADVLPSQTRARCLFCSPGLSSQKCATVCDGSLFSDFWTNNVM